MSTSQKQQSEGLVASERQVRETGGGAGAALVQVLAEIPEEEVWLAGLRSERTRRAYRLDVEHFMTTIGITAREELRQVDRAAIIYWQREMEKEGAKPSTIRRRLSALSSLFSHLVHHRLVDQNPVREVKRPRINRRTGTTPSFSKQQARQLLDAPPDDTVQGLRDRALLAVGLQVGSRRAEIASLAVGDFYQDQGYWALRITLKGGTTNVVSVNPQTAKRIIAYLDAAGHKNDPEAPLFLPVRGNQKVNDTYRHLHPDQIARILRKWVRKALGVERGFSAHSMRATFATRALENGCPLEDVQRDMGHADPSTTKLYDRRGRNPDKSASFFATY